MNIIPTRLTVEECIIQCNKSEISTIIQALSFHRQNLLFELQKDNDERNATIRMKLKEIEALENVLHSHYRIPLTTGDER